MYWIKALHCHSYSIAQCTPEDVLPRGRCLSPVDSFQLPNKFSSSFCRMCLGVWTLTDTGCGVVPNYLSIPLNNILNKVVLFSTKNVFNKLYKNLVLATVRLTKHFSLLLVFVALRLVECDLGRRPHILHELVPLFVEVPQCTLELCHNPTKKRTFCILTYSRNLVIRQGSGP